MAKRHGQILLTAAALFSSGFGLFTPLMFLISASSSDLRTGFVCFAMISAAALLRGRAAIILGMAILLGVALWASVTLEFHPFIILTAAVVHFFRCLDLRKNPDGMAEKLLAQLKLESAVILVTLFLFEILSSDDPPGPFIPFLVMFIVSRLAFFSLAYGRETGNVFIPVLLSAAIFGGISVILLSGSGNWPISHLFFSLFRWIGEGLFALFVPVEMSGEQRIQSNIAFGQPEDTPEMNNEWFDGLLVPLFFLGGLLAVGWILFRLIRNLLGHLNPSTAHAPPVEEKRRFIFSGSKKSRKNVNLYSTANSRIRKACVRMLHLLKQKGMIRDRSETVRDFAERIDSDVLNQFASIYEANRYGTGEDLSPSEAEKWVRRLEHELSSRK
jgi:hypothetical protein